MSNATVSRVGQIDGSGSALALFLKVFSGEVLAAFHAANIFDSRHMTRSISEGITAQFPTTGLAVARYHTPGAEIVGQVIKHGERTISIDGLLIADAFVALWDELVNHYDVRAPYAAELGQALSKAYDEKLCKVIIKAARAAALITGHPAGSSVDSGTTVATDAAVFSTALWAAAQAMDEKSVSEMDRYAAVTPAMFYLLVRATSGSFLHTDFGNAGNGSQAEGKLRHAAGFEIVKTLHLPTGDATANAADALENNNYAADYTYTRAICWQKAAAGTVKRLELTSENTWDPRRQGTLLLSKFAVGHGILRPACAYEIKETASP